MDIRPTQIDELPELSEFLTRHGMTRSPEVLRWKFWASPGQLRGPDRSFVAKLGGRIVGHVGVLPATVHLGSAPDGERDSGWFVDWMVRQDLRSRGVGIFLLREAAGTCHSLMTIQGSADTRNALGQLKWSANRRLAVYKLNLRAGAMEAGASIWRKATAELARVLRYHPVIHRPPGGWRLTEPAQMQAPASWSNLDAVLARESQSGNGSLCHCGRSAAFLQWSFRDHPTHRYHLSIADNGGEPDAESAGYAIWRTRLRPDGHLDARIVDVGLPWDRPDAWRWFISALTAHLAAAGVVQISCLAGIDSPLADALRANRYRARQRLPVWTCPQAAELTEHTRWHLTFADSDIDTAAEA